MKQHLILFYFFNFRCNRAIISRSGAMFRQRIFQSLIGPLTFDAAFYFILFFFYFRFNRALFSCSGAVVRHRNFQSWIGPVNRGSKPLKQHFILFFSF